MVLLLLQQEELRRRERLRLVQGLEWLLRLAREQGLEFQRQGLELEPVLAREFLLPEQEPEFPLPAVVCLAQGQPFRMLQATDRSISW